MAALSHAAIKHYCNPNAAGAEGDYGNMAADMVKLLITHSNLQRRMHEIKFDLHTTVRWMCVCVCVRVCAQIVKASKRVSAVPRHISVLWLHMLV